VKIMEKEPQKMRVSTAGKFETRLPEVKSYKISAATPGYVSSEQVFEVPALNNDTTLNVEVLLKPVPKQLMLVGNVYDKKTEQLITANLSVALKEDKSTQFKLTADAGRFGKEITRKGWYVITASAEGYLNNTDSIEVADNELSPFSRDLYLTPVEVGTTVRLKNIYFDFDKTTLKKESFPELNKVVEFLKVNPNIEIEIAGHTDNKGTDDYNINLSQGRSQSVVDYIVSQGIDSGRLGAHGYGEGKPIETNGTDGGRAVNRRVEFTVLKM
jgi:OOP family OmpA-OmpF porin